MRRSEEVIILNHPFIPSPKFIEARTTQEIGQIMAKDVPLLPFDLKLLRYCFDNRVAYAVNIASASEAVYANALHANYLFCNLKTAKEVQKIADHYLFDSKVIAKIDERLLDKAIAAGIDGVYLISRGI